MNAAPGRPNPPLPPLGAVRTLRLNPSEAETPWRGVFTDLALLELRMLRVCPGASQTRAPGGKEASPPPSAPHSEGGRPRCQGAGRGLLPWLLRKCRPSRAKSDGRGPRASRHGKPSASGLPGLGAETTGDTGQRPPKAPERGRWWGFGSGWFSDPGGCPLPAPEVGFSGFQ